MAKEIGVLAFGRMNPPTVGHQKLVDKVNEVARSVNGHPHIFLSHTQNDKKDPLSYADKIRYAKRAFGDKLVYRSSSKTIIEVMKELQRMGHKKIIYIAGSDRVPEFNTLLKKYNGKEYNFDSIEVRSAGERDPDAEGVSGMSASKLRGLAVSGKFNEFKRGLPQTLSNNAKEIYNKIRSAMSINEAMAFDITEADVDDILKTINTEIIDDEDLEDLGIDMVKFLQDLDDEDEDDIKEERQPLSIAQRRKLGIRMRRLAPKLARQRKMRAKRLAPPERILFRARKAAINLLRKKVAGKKGEAYASLGAAQKIQIDKMIMSRRPLVSKIAKRLLPKVRKAEMERLKRARSTNEERQVRQDKDIADRPGTQPAKYFKDLSKSTKAARDRHFDKYGAKPDSQGSAYKPAPGDAGAETKPSVHTKKYKAMFGESVHPAITDIDTNLKHRNETIKKNGYGPANPDEPGNFWKEKANLWGIDEATAKTMKCENCAAFNQAPRILDQIKKALDHSGPDYQDKVIAKSGMGFCEFFEFKCAATRTCDAWVHGGPITEQENVARTKAQHKREKENQKRDHDREMDRARLADVRAKNRMSEAKRGRPTKDEAEPDNFIMQLRRVADLNTGGEVKFNDGSKAKISKAIAQHAVNKYNKMNKPAEKLKFMRMMQRNVKSFKKQLMAGYDADDQMIPAFDRTRVSMISGSYPRGDAKLENAIYKATDVDEAFEQYNAGRKPLKAYSMYNQDPTASPLSSINPRDNYLLEKDLAALRKKAEKSGIPYGTLKKVYDRGMAAWKTGHRPGTTPHQWAFARVNSFITKGKGTWGGADKDLAKSVKKEQFERDLKLSEISPELKKRYKDKAASDQKFHQYSADTAKKMGPEYKDAQDYYARKAQNRAAGIQKASEAYEWGTDASVDHYASGTPGQNFDDLKRQQSDQVVPKPELAKTARQIEKEAMDPNRQKAQDASMAAIKKLGFKKYDPKKYEKSPEQKAQIKKDQEASAKKASMDSQKKAQDIAKRHDHKLDPKHTNAYMTGYQHGKSGTMDRKASSAYGPGHGSYLKGHEAGSKEAKKPQAESFDLNESFVIAMGAGYSAAPTARELGIEMQAGYSEHPSVQEQTGGNCGCNPEPIEEAEYQGKSVTLNDPIRTSEVPSKKFKVYVKDPSTGNIKVVRFGDPGLSIKRDDPDRRKSFRARHNCDNPGPKTKARYWSCYQWRSGSKVDN